MISFTLILVIGLIGADDSSLLRKTNTALRSALDALTAESAVAVQVSEEASVGARCDCSGGKANRYGNGGDNCSSIGNHNKVPWCYVGTNSGCNDLRGSARNPWSEEACAFPSQPEQCTVIWGEDGLFSLW